MVMKLLIPFAVLGVSAVSSAALAVPVSASGPDRPHMIHARHGGHVAPRRPDEEKIREARRFGPVALFCRISEGLIQGKNAPRGVCFKAV